MLSVIQGPESLKHLTARQLKILAAEVRKVIIETVASKGGHLASNLGAVELTLALHAVFDAPRDKLLWDGGHQTFTHELLTGRRERFATVRRGERPAGVTYWHESAPDVSSPRPASTSISTAVGLVEARELEGEDFEVVAIIGDSAITAGVAHEGLTRAANLGTKMLVVFNDSAFAPASRWEAFSAFLSRLLSGRVYTSARTAVGGLVRTIPGVGEPVAKVGARLEEAARGLLSPLKRFRELGFAYLGPIKGHHIPHLQQAFEAAKGLDRPVLVHVVTRPGKGYRPSEQHPGVYQAVGAFDPATGRPSARPGPPTYTEVFSNALVALAEEDASIVAVTAGPPGSEGLKPFAKRFPDRFYDVGRAVQHAVIFAAGLACQGLKPVVALPSTGLQRGFDQVLHDVCFQNLSVTFTVEHPGLVGEDEHAPYGIFDLSYLRLAPTMVLMVPKDGNELGPMLAMALAQPGPSVLRYPRGVGVGLGQVEGEQPLEMGKAELLRSGRHVAIWACGSTVWPAYGAAERLAEEGIEAAVVNARFIKPLDNALLCEQARQVGFLVTVEENTLAGGFGSAVLEVLEMARLVETKVHRIGLPDRFIEQGSLSLLRRTYGLDAEGIAASVRRALETRQPLPLRHARGSTG
ncbi:MAG: 1-deoxy-D-xylulose-5-phosphate synthase [Nitrospinota bacterium]